ncbi:regulatory signaling modulator protein AmpE [Hylemonella sp. W303a]|uniref:regulatory signaling modulator protein AmpE n=1 Tax=Hylemonella sp. W303a TaxID=3389873 RepID=UPI00396B4458
MSFFSLLLALLIEQARPLGRGNVVHARVRAWLRWVVRKFDIGRSPWLAWGIAVLLPAVAATCIYLWLKFSLGWFGILLALAWNVAVLYLTLGFRQFSFHFSAIRDALEAGDEQTARRLLAEWQQIDASELPPREIIRHVLEYSVVAAHRHVLGVLCWFLVGSLLGLGPAGAVFYRLSELITRYWPHVSRKQAPWVSEGVLAVSARAWSWVDWLPARATAFGFAVAGRFEDAVDAWRRHEEFKRMQQKEAQESAPGTGVQVRVEALAGARPGEQLADNSRAQDNDHLIIAALAGALNVRLGLSEASRARLGEGVDWQEPQLAHLRSSVGLIWRAVVFWMLLLALVTVGRWLA